MDSSAERRSTLLGRTKKSFENLHINDGTYLSPEHRLQLLDNSQIIHLKELAHPKHEEGIGTFRQIGFVTKQGYGYSALVGEPEHPGSALNVPIIGTTAWFTGITKGFNKETASNYMKDGHFYLGVGAEGSYGQPFEIEPTSPVSQADSAAAVLRFVNEFTDILYREGHPVDLHRRIVAGPSRGGNVGLGISNLAPDYDQTVIAAQILAARYPEKLTIYGTIPLARQVGSEALRALTLPLALGPSITKRYVPSFELNRNSMRHHVEIGGAIFNGEAGMFVAGIDRSQYLDLELLSHDAPHEHPVWQEKLWAHTNAEVRIEAGRHIDIPLKRIQNPLRERMRAIQACVEQSIPLTHENVNHMVLEVKGLNRSIGKRALRVVG